MNKLSILPSVQFFALSLGYVGINLLCPQSATAASFDLSFTRLEGIINVNPINKAGTAVYRATLSDPGFDLTAIKISDILSLQGSPGKFSGFDLDAIKISYQLTDVAEDVKYDTKVSRLNVLDFTSNQTTFLPGTLRDPGDSKFKSYFTGKDLFGSQDGKVDNRIATLGQFDANAITNENANGFLSLGDGGAITFQLSQQVSIARPIYIYIAEVGNNGEQARSLVTVSVKPKRVPEPTIMVSLSLMALYLTTLRKKQNQ